MIGGYRAGIQPEVELIDLSGQGRTCRNPESFPSADYGSVGAYFQERALVCGGGFYWSTGNIFSSECYYYNTNGTWTQGPSMTESRLHAASTFFNNQWWISGGSSSYGIHTSTELFNNGSNSFVTFADLPGARNYHNLVAMDDNKAILLGGKDYNKYTFIFNGTWNFGPILSKGRRQSHAGQVTFKNGTRMIVAASGMLETTTEFLNVDGDRWHFGPELPYYFSLGASVQLDDTFLIVGGVDALSKYLDTIWAFNIETEEWTLLDQHLTTGRRSTAAFLVPDDFC